MRPVILIADDDPDDQILLRRAFEDGGDRVSLCIVSDGAQALDYLNQRGNYEDAEPASLMLLDLNMPKKNGHQVLAEVRANDSLARIPIVVLTTSNHPDEIDRCYAAGATSFITKPSDFTQMVACVEQIRAYWLELVTPPTDLPRRRG